MKTSSFSLEDRIIASAARRGGGAVFLGEDFSSLGSSTAVRQALSRLTRAGKIRRIGVGLYYYPVFNQKLGFEVRPSMEDVARAIARRTGSRIVATGAQAANLLGLSTQVPVKPIYLTDASSRKVPVGSYSIVFRHAGPRRVGAKHNISIMLFEALRWLGRVHVDDSVVARLQHTLPPAAKAEIRADLPRAPIWIRAVAEKVVA